MQISEDEMKNKDKAKQKDTKNAALEMLEH